MPWWQGPVLPQSQLHSLWQSHQWALHCGLPDTQGGRAWFCPSGRARHIPPIPRMDGDGDTTARDG